MAVLTIDDLKKLKPFFQVLETFRRNPSAKFASLDGERIQINKAECLNLLRSRFSSLSGKEFKDDNFLINYLSKQKNQDEILSELPKNQWEELSQQLVTETTPEGYGQQTTNSEQPTPIGESAGTMAGGGAGLPFAPSTPSTPTPRGVRIIQSTPPEEGPATAKIRRLQEAYEQANPATAKINRLEEQAKAFNATKPMPATAKMERLQSAATNPGIRFKQGFGSNLRTFGSKAGTFFQRNVGKYLTVGRAATGIGAVIGGFTGAGLTGGSSMGVLGGAIGGGVLPSWFKSGGGGRFFRGVGNGIINASSRLSNQISRPSLFKGGASKRIVWIFLGVFLLIAVGAGLLGALTGGGATPSGGSGNVGIGATSPISSGGTQPTAPTVDPSGLKQKIIDQFGIAMNGYNDDHLKWAWEKFWDVSSTNFIGLTRGSVIEARSGSEQVGCPGATVAVYLDQYPETLFKYGLIHELGHVIRNCHQPNDILKTEHLNAFNKEGGVTYYANNAYACTRSDNGSEDYAEMIALYLNPSANIQMTTCTPAKTKYTNLRTEFQLHYNVARSILGDF